MTPSDIHELVSNLIDHFITEWQVARRIDVRPSGSMTLRRASADRGLESNLSYYIENDLLLKRDRPFDIDLDRPPGPRGRG